MIKKNDSYLLKMKFCTDGDFAWNEIPGVINYTAFETYEAEFKIASREDLEIWNQIILPKWRENLKANRMYDIVQDWFNKLEDAIDRNKDMEFNIGGNYDGSYIILKNTHGKLNVEIPLKADLYKRLNESGISNHELEVLIEKTVAERENKNNQE